MSAHEELQILISRSANISAQALDDLREAAQAAATQARALFIAACAAPTDRDLIADAQRAERLAKITQEAAQAAASAHNAIARAAAQLKAAKVGA